MPTGRKYTKYLNCEFGEFNKGLGDPLLREQLEYLALKLDNGYFRLHGV